MKYIGIFLFVGFASVLFGTNGWYPHEGLGKISSMAYGLVLPCLIGFAAGETIGEESGGVIGLLASIGIVAASDRIGILGAMLMGPVCGLCAKYVVNALSAHTKASLQMLVRNLLIAAVGGVFCLFGYGLLAPFLGVVSHLASAGIDYLIQERWIVLSNILIEPAKVLFLNNGINHAILTPLGIQQVEETGKSVLFLLETNPGPGLGVLLALLCQKKTKKEQYAAGLFVQGIGGIHEVYFPFILTNLKLILALILGGMAGTFCFVWTGAGLSSPVSPGSIITILLMAGQGDIVGVLLGIVVAALVSFVAGWVILLPEKCTDKRKHLSEETKAERQREAEGQREIDQQEETEQQEKAGQQEKIDQQEEAKQQKEVYNMEEKQREAGKAVHKIGFVCDGGVGSSVMGAAIFRRSLKAQRITDVDVKAYAVDEIPEDLDMIVCQKDFIEMLPEKSRRMEIQLLENLVSSESYAELLAEIQVRRG